MVRLLSYYANLQELTWLPVIRSLAMLIFAKQRVIFRQNKR